MAQLDDLYAALKNADAAGDVEGARKLAAYIKSSASAAPASTPQPIQERSLMSRLFMRDPGTPEPPTLFSDPAEQVTPAATRAQAVAPAGFAVGATADIGNALLNLGVGGIEKLRNALTQPTLSEAVTGRRAPSPLAAWNADRADSLNALTQVQDPVDRAPFAAGRLAGNVAATAPVGGALGEVAQAVQMPRLASSLASSGMTTGSVPVNGLAGRAADLGIRAAGGGLTGGATMALLDPEHIGTGAAAGAALPPVVRGAGALGDVAAEASKAGARRLMQSALKPTIAQLKNGDAGTAVQTLLDYGINPTEKGVSKLKEIISGLNDQIGSAVNSSTAKVNKQAVVNALADTRQKFANQVSPTSDLGAISNVENDFLNHPLAPNQDIPVQVAQRLKQGTYKVLGGKYGQLGSAETEAQKAIARGLKNEIASAVPEVGPLNAEESRLLSTLTVAERRALMDMNKNPVGLASLAHSPVGWAVFMADKSAGFKALAARMFNSAAAANPLAATQNMLESAGGGLLSSSLGAAVRSGQNANP